MADMKAAIRTARRSRRQDEHRVGRTDEATATVVTEMVTQGAGRCRMALIENGAGMMIHMIEHMQAWGTVWVAMCPMMKQMGDEAEHRQGRITPWWSFGKQGGMKAFAVVLLTWFAAACSGNADGRPVRRHRRPWRGYGRASRFGLGSSLGAGSMMGADRHGHDDLLTQNARVHVTGRVSFSGSGMQGRGA